MNASVTKPVHQVDEETKPFPCKLCSKSFGRKFILKRHLKTHQKPKKEKKIVVCPFCLKKFNKRSRMLRHMPTHARKHELRCEKCGKKYIRECYYHDHKQQCLTQERVNESETGIDSEVDALKDTLLPLDDAPSTYSSMIPFDFSESETD